MNLEEALVEAVCATLRERYPLVDDTGIEAAARLICVARTQKKADMVHVLLAGCQQQEMWTAAIIGEENA